MKEWLLRVIAPLLGVGTAVCPICGGWFRPLKLSVWDWQFDAPVCFKCESEAVRRNRYLYAIAKEE